MKNPIAWRQAALQYVDQLINHFTLLSKSAHEFGFQTVDAPLGLRQQYSTKHLSNSLNMCRELRLSL